MIMGRERGAMGFVHPGLTFCSNRSAFFAVFLFSFPSFPSFPSFL